MTAPSRPRAAAPQCLAAPAPRSRLRTAPRAPLRLSTTGLWSARSCRFRSSVPTPTATARSLIPSLCSKRRNRPERRPNRDHGDRHDEKKDTGIRRGCDRIPRRAALLCPALAIRGQINDRRRRRAHIFSRTRLIRRFDLNRLSLRSLEAFPTPIMLSSIALIKHSRIIMT